MSKQHAHPVLSPGKSPHHCRQRPAHGDVFSPGSEVATTPAVSPPDRCGSYSARPGAILETLETQARHPSYKILRSRRDHSGTETGRAAERLPRAAWVLVVVLAACCLTILARVSNFAPGQRTHINIHVKSCGAEGGCSNDSNEKAAKPQPRVRWQGALPRGTRDGIRRHGSIFGFFKLKLNCPAAPEYEYQPQVFWERGLLSETYSQPVPLPGRAPDLLVGILSSCKSRAARDTVRNTWLRLVPAPGLAWKAVFIISSGCQDSLAAEQNDYNDLLFVDVKDSYFTLTRKVLLFLDYAHQVGANFTMKTDDDSYVFVDRYLQELDAMPKGKCLYWGQANRLPDGRKYKHTVLAVPLHKWYIPKTQYMTLLEQTLYMQGGGYVLSQDLVAKVAAREEEPPEYLPEDAIVARMVGSESVSSCMCSDTRIVKEAYSFQQIDLFRATTMPCERADIAHRTLNVHGIRKVKDMQTFHREGTEPLVPCDLSNRRFYGPEHRQLWGHQQLPRKAREEYQLGEGPTFAREAKLYNLLKGKRKRNYNDQELVPLVILTGNTDTDQKLPWCLRMTWASQMIDLLTEMSQQQRLLCNLVRSSFFVNATSLELWIDRGPTQVQLQYQNHTRLQAGRWCFSDELCQTCFLMPSKDFLDSGKCDMETHRCIGYDGVSLAQVMIQKAIKPLFDKKKFPQVPTKKFMSQIHAILDQVMKVKRNSMQIEPQDWIVHRLSNSFKGMEEAYGSRIDTCMDGNRESLVTMLSEKIDSKLEADRRQAEQEAQSIMAAAAELDSGQHGALELMHGAGQQG